MIECLPQSFLSSGYTASGLSNGEAALEYNWFTEQGAIISAHNSYDIRKHGAFSGHWTFELSGRVLVDARKPSAFFRTFEITGEGLFLTLEAESAFTRAFTILSEQRIVGRIAPAHAFTRRASIECSDEIPEHIQLFAFWLVGLAWRRSARSNSGAAS